MNPYSVALEMTMKQRREIRQHMADANRDRHYKKYKVLEKQHAKLSDKINDYQQKILAA